MSPNRDVVIGVDCSTTASKAVVWDRHGAPLAEGRRTFPLLMPRPGWHEQQAEEWWTATTQALREATAQMEKGRLAALCLTHQRETFVPVDEEGHPLRNAIVWMDERCRTVLPLLDRLYGAGRIHQLTGKPLSINPSLGKILWLRENEPAVFSRTHKFLDVHAFLVHRLTGHFRTSWGCADPMGLFDMRQHRWAEDLIRSLGLRQEQLADAQPPGTVMGEVTEQAAAACGLPAGLPVVAGVGDGQAAGLGANITRPGQAYLNLGTAIVSGAYAETYTADRAFRTMNGAIPGTYLLETVLLGGTYTINWFVDHFAGVDASALDLGLSAEELLEAASRKVPPGALGLLLVPYWNSVMNPYWNAAASGIVVGWRGSHDRRHLYRALLEGIAFEQRLHTSGVEAATGQQVESFIAMGGGARSPLWCQIIADITGKPVFRSASPEATALGAGILAATAAGLFSDLREAATAMTRTEPSPFVPDDRRHAFYTRLYEEVYRHLYPALRTYLDRLTELASEKESG
jgi:sugar (pentulose or hexulose) kinase